jgi:branched-chain amino acid transport system substrate-binding protein
MKKYLFSVLAITVFLFGTGGMAIDLCNGSEPIRLGGIWSLTGPAAHIGIAQKNAVTIILEEVNNSGGINGRPVDIIVADDESDPTKAIVQLKKMLQTHNDILAFIGPTRTDTGMAIIPFVQQNRIPTLMQVGGDAVLKPIREWVFAPSPRTAQALERMLKYMKNKGMDRMGWLNSSDGFGKSGLASIKSLAPKFGIEIVGEETFSVRDVDMTVQLSRISAKKPNAIVIWTIGPAIGIATKNAKSIGIESPVFLCHGAGDPILFKLAGAAAEKVLVPSNKMMVADQLPDSDVHKKRIQDFIKKYKQKFKSIPGAHVGEAANPAYIVFEAIKRAGSDRKQIRDTIENLKDFPALTSNYSFSPTNHCGFSINDMVIMQARGGMFKLVEH